MKFFLLCILGLYIAVGLYLWVRIAVQELRQYYSYEPFDTIWNLAFGFVALIPAWPYFVVHAKRHNPD